MVRVHHHVFILCVYVYSGSSVLWWTLARTGPVLRTLSVTCPFRFIMIVMYSYDAHINTLSAHSHMIRMNLNTIFCTHIEHSPIQTVYINTHTHIHHLLTKNPTPTPHPWFLAYLAFLPCVCVGAKKNIMTIQLLFLKLNHAFLLLL